MTEPLFTVADTDFMRRALELAQQGEALGEVPVGAVLVHEGAVIGEGFNCPISRHDPTAHAEVMALRAAAARSSNYRLENTTLYVTLEPCTMCVGALVHARVARVVFAATEPKSGSLLSARRQLESGYYNHVFQFEAGLLGEEAGAMLSQFFRKRRREEKAAGTTPPLTPMDGR
jgi:tRNA(Arg) A34 adenosine deaminase TadA